jgi:hypothetical protein
MSERKKTLLASVNLIGDTLTQTPAVRRYRALHPDEEVHWMIQDAPMRSVLEGMPGAGVCDSVLFDSDWDRVRRLDYPDYDKRVLMDVQEAFRIGSRAGVHIAQAYGMMLGVEVPGTEILPTVPLRPRDSETIGVPPRCLVISPCSASNARMGEQFAGNKHLPWHVWGELIARFVDAGRVENYVVLLAESDPTPEIPLCILRLPLSLALSYIAEACASGGAYSGVDNGITHAAAGLRVPTFCVYPRDLPPGWTGYGGFDHYRIAVTTPWKGDTDEIWRAWRERLS